MDDKLEKMVKEVIVVLKQCSRIFVVGRGKRQKLQSG
jgi:hypothetical protein